MFYSERKIIEQIVSNKKLQPLLVDQSLIINIINLITEEKDELYSEDSTVELVLLIDSDLFDSSISELIINKIAVILSYEISQAYDNRESIKEKKAKFCYQLLSKIILDKNKREKISQPNLDVILDVLITKHDHINWNQKYFILPLLYRLSYINNNDSKLKIYQNILAFVSNSDLLGFEKFYKFTETSDILTVDESIKVSLIERAITSEELLSLIYLNTETVQTEILRKLLINNNQFFIRFLKNIDYKIKNKVEIVNSIIEETQKDIAPLIKYNLYAIIDKINPSLEGLEVDSFILQ